MRDTGLPLDSGHELAGCERAFVFGGGGVLGFAWMVGALSAVEHERGLTPTRGDLLLGTSAGSVLSALLARGVELAGIRRHQLGMPLPQDPPISWNYEEDSGGGLPPRPRVLPGSPRLAWNGLRRRGVPPVVALAGLLPPGRGTLEPIRRLIAGLPSVSSPPDSVPDGDGGMTWPGGHVWIVATDYSSGERVVFGRPGAPVVPLPDAVCASCAIPAWYRPVAVGGRSYIDGGTSSNTSLDLLVGSPPREVYVFAPMASLTADSPRTPAALVERRVRHAITRRLVADVEALRDAGAEVTVLTPGPEDLREMGANVMNTRRRTAVLQTSLRTSAVELRELRRRNQRRGSRQV